MSHSQLIDGKKIAAEIRAELKERVQELQRSREVTPGLAVVLVGTDPASAIYVRNKTRACDEVGVAHFDYYLPETTAADELLQLIDQLNRRSDVHGILVQLPLPAQIDPKVVISRLAPYKDVDGFHPLNLGLLFAGTPRFVPCTPLGIDRLITNVRDDISGLNALVVGRSANVGRPTAQLLLHRNCTVTIAHSKTQDLAEYVAHADILVAAIGRPELIKGEWVKSGAMVIDVGINRRSDGTLVGDVEFQGAAARASAITPVPGGVGPMTIAMLLNNTILAAESS